MITCNDGSTYQLRQVHLGPVTLSAFRDSDDSRYLSIAIELGRLSFTADVRLAAPA